LRDNALVKLRKKFEKAEQERDDLKLTLEKFQTSSKNLSKLLESQYPIIDWEIHNEGLRTYWKIIRVGGITEAYQSFEDMLKGFDREDLVALWNLVKEKFSSAVPREDKEKALWVELKRLFEPNADDVFWKLQRYMHDSLTWKLYTNYERSSDEDLHGGQQTKEQKFGYILQVIKMIELKKLDV
nr:hypothetical protein [Tanacetum cinerariifolium]